MITTVIRADLCNSLLFYFTKKGIKNYEKNYLHIKTTVTINLSFKIQSPEWIKRTRNLDSVVW